MLNLGTGELLVIGVIALVILGPSRLPEAARQVGKAMGEMRRLSTGFQAEVQQAMREPAVVASGGPATDASPRRAEPLRASRSS